MPYFVAVFYACVFFHSPNL